MKAVRKIISCLICLVLVNIFVSCQSTKIVSSESAQIDQTDQTDQTDQYQQFLYIVSKDELEYFMQSWNWLKNWDAGEIHITDDEFAELYESEMNKNTFSSMLYENFFRNTANSEIQKQLQNYILKNNLGNKNLEKALLKKINSEKESYEQSGKTLYKYAYKNTEYDENINLFDFDEVHPFDDEFGMLVFNNDWQVLTFHSTETGEQTDDKNFILMVGGGTNTISIGIEEIENIKINSKEDIEQINKIKNIASKYKDDWFFEEIEQVEILENCGVDKYYIGYGIGPDRFISEIAGGDFVTCLYNSKTNKVYIVDTYMNFSKININYEIKDRLYNYLLFFTLFCYCN